VTRSLGACGGDGWKAVLQAAEKTGDQEPQGLVLSRGSFEIGGGTVMRKEQVVTERKTLMKIQGKVPLFKRIPLAAMFSRRRRICEEVLGTQENSLLYRGKKEKTAKTCTQRLGNRAAGFVRKGDKEEVRRTKLTGSMCKALRKSDPFRIRCRRGGRRADYGKNFFDSAK